MEQERLSPKEERFCQCLAAVIDPAEAAKRAGYSPERGRALLTDERIERRFEQLLVDQQPSARQVVKGLERLALGSPGVAGYGGGSGVGKKGQLEIRELDLFYVSRILCGAKGVEVVFYDRLEALRILLEFTSNQQQEGRGQRLMEALERAACAVEEE